mmetsp:Transcript_11327/g.27316  ORF Transcript_11327/g.27316 Transcript_11327/m.27316 type:complete len:187 (+) Transcript_11327:294-854(+)
MSDITITDADGNVQYSLDSKDGTTVGDLLSIIGAGVLRKDGVLKANKNYILVPGTYTLERPPEPKPEPDEYNGISLVERNALRTQFEQQQVGLGYKAHKHQISHTQGSSHKATPAGRDLSTFGLNSPLAIFRAKRVEERHDLHLQDFENEDRAISEQRHLMRCIRKIQTIKKLVKAQLPASKLLSS